MSFPLAHGLVGASVVIALDNQIPFKNWKLILLGAILAITPDSDYLVNWLQVFGNGWHHGFSHSLCFAVLLGAAATLLTGQLSWRRFLILSLAAVSHGLLDFLFTDSWGIALLSPFSNYRFKLMLPKLIDYNWRGDTILEMSGEILKISFAELMIFAPIFLFILFLKRKLMYNSEASQTI